ncbi:MAG: CRISPR-associated endonuclease Cas2 [Thiohalorhabdaceae bacterium]
MKRNAAVIAYDIASDHRRRRIHRILLAWRLDGQKSVHECLLSASEARELFIQLAGETDPDHDRLLLAWLEPDRPIHTRGQGRVDRLFRKVLKAQ